MFAARNGSIPTLELLIGRGASVNAKERVHGQTALMWAVGENHQDAVRFLIAHGADINAQSSIYLPPPVPAQRVGQAAGAGSHGKKRQRLLKERCRLFYTRCERTTARSLNFYSPLEQK